MKYVGVKQVLRAAQNDEVKVVYIAKDAEKRVTEELIKVCTEKNIDINYIETMEELGKLAGVDVKSSAAAE